MKHEPAPAIFLRQRQIALLLSLVQTRHLGRTADELHMSQPAASKALAQLEEQVGHQLFERSGSGTHPTSLGVLVIDYARNLAGAAHRAAEDVAAALERGRKTLRIGILPSTSIHITPRLVAALLARDPAIEISIIEGLLHELLTQLNRYELDCVIGRNNTLVKNNEVASLFLHEDPVVLAVGAESPAASEAALSLEQALSLPWILPVQGTVLRARMEEMFYRLGVPRPQRHIESNAVLTNVILLNQHAWVAGFPSVIAEHFEAQGRLRTLPIDTRSNIGNVEAMTRRDEAPSPPLALALDLLMEMFPREATTTR